MTKRPITRPWLWLGGALLLGALGGIRWAGGTSGGDPLATRPCGECHRAAAQVSEQNAKLLVRAPEQLCTNCHPGAVEASHPSGVAPSMAVPAQFPLDWKSHLTCSSCHFIHSPAHGLLRAEERGAAFCTACHPRSFFDAMADQGGSLLVSGHMQSGTDLALALTDEYSVQCMACHDERGQGPGVELIGSNIARHATGSMEHPIGVDYAQAYAYGGYRSPEELPPSISLPGGQVSCISCHEGYSSTHGKMVSTNEGSNLCFQCHAL